MRQAVRKRAVELGFNLVDQTKIVTASSELARNTLDYGGGGKAYLETVGNGTRTGLRLIFEDGGRAFPIFSLRSRTDLRPAQEWGSAWAARKGCRMNSRFNRMQGEGTRVSIVRWKGL